MDQSEINALKIFFLHIPKTGGQTLATRLASAFPIGRSDILRDRLAYPEGVAILKKLGEEKDFIEKHVRGPVLSESGGFDILVTVREPVSQVVSNYLHIKREPRNNLYRAVQLLSPKEFFLRFGDLIANFQTERLISAFFSIEGPRKNRFQTFSNLMFESLEKIRWKVPTESIDEFVRLWSIETGMYVPNDQAVLNVAPKGRDYEDLLEIVREMPWLYSLDLTLWDIVRNQYDLYRKNILSKAVPWLNPNDVTRAYYVGQSGLWLKSGWHPPQLDTPVGTAWWAGPENKSEIAYVKNSNQRFIKFSIVVYCGVEQDRIFAVSDDGFTPLKMVFRQEGESRWTYWIDIENKEQSGAVYLWVDEVWAPIMTSSDSLEIERKSFATCDWALVSALPDGELVSIDFVGDISDD